jgi:phosphatidylserine/phosphatidylglycerophosphate/cardiolipin synthase-like enzyme
MRKSGTPGAVRLRAIAGSHVVLMAWDLDATHRVGLHGFAIKRQTGSSTTPTWLRGLKYFKSVVTAPVTGATYSSLQQPFQTFLWSDYEVTPDTQYTFTVVPLYGTPAALEQRQGSDVTIRTEMENDGRHGIWFNRGVIASHALDVRFQNRQVTDAIANQVDANGQISDQEAQWLSRGLAEACVTYINSIKPQEALRVCAYEFTYPVILNALNRALERGVDVRIVYHFTKKDNDPNLKAIRLAGLPEYRTIEGRKTQILFQRTRTKIPHNKFMVKLVGGNAEEVWTGSTNFTSSAFLGQTNVGHLVVDSDTATTYLKFWAELSEDPTLSNAVKKATDLTPNPPNMIAPHSVTKFYSPRIAENMLHWYAARIDDAAALVMMTIPFNVAPQILTGLAQTRESLRLVILENPPTQEVLAAQKRNAGKLLFSNGAILGKQFIRNPRGGGKVVPIAHSPLEKWFVDEELARPVNNGHVFFVHSKVLLIDPLSDDPLVCSGSANFSKNSLTANDENMLLIRGETRVADIYLTEFDRIFRHFYARDAINRFAQKGNTANPLVLDETSAWIDEYYHPGGYKNNRRLLFFPDPAAPAPQAWTIPASKDPDVFRNEEELAKQNRANRRAPGKRAGKTTRGKRKAPKKTPVAQRSSTSRKMKRKAKKRVKKRSSKSR